MVVVAAYRARESASLSRGKHQVLLPSLRDIGVIKMVSSACWSVYRRYRAIRECLRRSGGGGGRSGGHKSRESMLARHRSKAGFDFVYLFVLPIAQSLSSLADRDVKSHSLTHCGVRSMDEADSMSNITVVYCPYRCATHYIVHEDYGFLMK